MDPSFYSIQETQFNIKNRHHLRGKGWKSISKNSKKQAGVVIVIYDKLDFKSNLMIRGREGYYIVTKGKMHQEGIAIFNIYAPKQGHPSS